MVEFKDASVIAQISSTDMKLPIQYALNYPNRESNICKELDFWNLANLSFEKPDFDTFKCLKLAFDAGKIGGIMPTILNGANEVLVELFLEEKVKFLEIPEIIEECMNRFYVDEYLTIEGILSTDKLVRSYIYEKYS